MTQIELIPDAAATPAGFSYHADFISGAVERALADAISNLDLVAPTMHGVAAKRRTAHFGRSYDFQTFKLGDAPPLPEFLHPLRERVAKVASVEPEDLGEILVTEYAPGAGIGWHRDAPQFGIIIGISLLAACTMRFRPWPVQKTTPSKRVKPLAQSLEPRSVYVLDGEARSRWQHHIPPIDELRYSLTFRTLRGHST